MCKVETIQFKVETIFHLAVKGPKYSKHKHSHAGDVAWSESESAQRWSNSSRFLSVCELYKVPCSYFYFYFSVFTLGVIITQVLVGYYLLLFLFCLLVFWVCFLLLRTLPFVCLSHRGILYRESCSVSSTALLNFFEPPLVFSSSAFHPRYLRQTLFAF